MERRFAKLPEENIRELLFIVVICSE